MSLLSAISTIYSVQLAQTVTFRRGFNDDFYPRILISVEDASIGLSYTSRRRLMTSLESQTRIFLPENIIQSGQCYKAKQVGVHLFAHQLKPTGLP